MQSVTMKKKARRQVDGTEKIKRKWIDNDFWFRCESEMKWNIGQTRSYITHMKCFKWIQSETNDCIRPKICLNKNVIQWFLSFWKKHVFHNHKMWKVCCICWAIRTERFHPNAPVQRKRVRLSWPDIWLNQHMKSHSNGKKRKHTQWIKNHLFVSRIIQ